MTITIEYDDDTRNKYRTLATIDYEAGFLWWKKKRTRRAFGGATVWHWEDTGERCSLGWESDLSDAWFLWRRDMRRRRDSLPPRDGQ